MTTNASSTCAFAEDCATFWTTAPAKLMMCVHLCDICRSATIIMLNTPNVRLADLQLNSGACVNCRRLRRRLIEHVTTEMGLAVVCAAPISSLSCIHRVALAVYLWPVCCACAYAYNGMSECQFDDVSTGDDVFKVIHLRTCTP